MEMQGRYMIAEAKLAERYAEAARARLVKGDGVSDARPVVVTGSTTPTLRRLRAKLGGFRFGHRPATAPAASAAR
jgi:hypothetical protein